MRYPVAQPDLRGRERHYVLEAIRETGISSVGRHVGAFEAAFALAVGIEHAIAVSNGTAALHLACCALGIGAGDEVIVPALTYVASANAVGYTGARVVLVDADADTWNIDVGAIAAAMTERTRAILAVHLYGNPAPLDELRALARRRRVALIEDAAEAFGATWRGKAVGTLGEIGCFSFFGNKIITTGEGGMVVTKSAALARRLRHLRDQAMSPRRRYFHDRIGFNYRMTALQAAIGLGQLERAPRFLARRARIAAWYRRGLASVAGVREPRVSPQARAVTWLYTVMVDGWNAARRDRCMAVLRRRGIDTRPLLVPMHRLPMYRCGGMPVAARLSARGISLPTYVGLGERDVQTIAAEVARAIAATR